MIFILDYILYLVYSITPGWIIFLLVFVIIVWEIVKHWSASFKPRDPYILQLTRASHGAAFFLLAPLTVYGILRYRMVYVPRELWPYIWPATLLFMGYGIYLFTFGWSRTRAYRKDAQLISKAIIKALAGVVLFGLLVSDDIPIQSLDQPYRAYTMFFGLFMCGWLAITGVTKLGLLLRPPPVEGEPVTIVANVTKKATEFKNSWHWN